MLLKYYITYKYKNINLEFNIRALNEEEAIRNFRKYFDKEVEIIEIKEGINMERLKELVKLAEEKDSESIIIVRNEKGGNWFVHFFIGDNKKSIFRRIGKDLDVLMNNLEAAIRSL